ncbi:hypothetical protein TNCT_442201 [Trichonephila clavata]|uniref:Uncharacterized protein n=1 Tax=Trichonephila clavata TaxID=2740835 RepID=A0A8X6H0E5_TRICU|nr:hypothetical protein TNCT_442201 [Trichonephila clavata]
MGGVIAPKPYAASTIDLALYHVARHGSTQQEAQEDLKKVLPNKDSRFWEIEGYGKKIPNIYGIIEETLRLNPPTVGNGRITKAKCVLGGYSIPEGVNMFLCIYTREAHPSQELYDE